MAQAFFSGAYVQGQTLDVIGTLSSVTSGTVQTEHRVSISTLLNDQVVYADGSATIDVALYQNLMVDVAYGTVVSGSINVSVRGFVPVVNLPGSTLIESGWFAGTVQTTQNLQVTEPLGTYAVVEWNVSGSVTGMYLLAERVT